VSMRILWIKAKSALLRITLPTEVEFAIVEP